MWSRGSFAAAVARVYMSPDEIEMIDVVDQGRRPRFKNGNPKDVGSKEAMRIRPGIELEHPFNEDAPGLIREMVIIRRMVTDVIPVGRTQGKRSRFFRSTTRA